MYYTKCIDIYKVYKYDIYNVISVVPALLTLPNFLSLSLSPMQEFGYRWHFALYHTPLFLSESG